MNKIQVFKTTDGKIFENENYAKLHEESLARYYRVQAWVRDNCYSTMQLDDIIDAIMEGRDDLKAAIK